MPWREARQRVLWWQLGIACAAGAWIGCLTSPQSSTTPCPVAPPIPVQPSPPPAPPHHHWALVLQNLCERWPTDWALRSLTMNAHSLHLQCQSRNPNWARAWLALQALLHRGHLQSVVHEHHGYRATIHYAIAMSTV